MRGQQPCTRSSTRHGCCAWLGLRIHAGLVGTRTDRPHHGPQASPFVEERHIDRRGCDRRRKRTHSQWTIRDETFKRARTRRGRRVPLGLGGERIPTLSVRSDRRNGIQALTLTRRGCGTPQNPLRTSSKQRCIASNLWQKMQRNQPPEDRHGIFVLHTYTTCSTSTKQHFRSTCRAKSRLARRCKRLWNLPRSIHEPSWCASTRPWKIQDVTKRTPRNLTLNGENSVLLFETAVPKQSASTGKNRSKIAKRSA